MYLYGASGHAKVIIDILTNREIDIQGVFDDDINIEKIFDYTIQPVPKEVETLDGRFIISIGDNKIRKSLSEKYSLLFGSAIHSSCIMSDSVSIGDGTAIMASAVINSSTLIGKHVIINTSASIDHDCVIGDYVHISPSACLCGGVQVGIGSHVGAGSVILPGVNVGSWSTVGAGCVVLSDVPAFSVVVGNPARILRELNK
jgi:sugar O-acyltransferase (sialic acid O-acetyltransferase NeuD family)